MYPDYLVHFNPNHDPKTGQFAPGAGGLTSNKIGARLKKTDLLNLDGPTAWRDFDNKTGNYSRLKAAADTGMKAMAKCGDKEPLEEGWDDWFLFEDQTFGMPQIADLANKGKTKDEIKQIIKDCQEYSKNDYFTDLPGVWALDEWANSNQYYTVDGDKYIDACIEVAKENRQLKQSGITKFGNYLCHFNKNHSPKNGQFTSGDGDGDNIRDDHHNYKKNKGDLSVSKSLKKYTGKNAEKNLKKDGYYKVASNLSKEYEKRYGDGSGKNTSIADKKRKNAIRNLDKKAEKMLLNGVSEQEVFDFYGNMENKIFNDDAVEYGRAWMKDIGFNDMDADVINKFLGKY